MISPDPTYDTPPKLSPGGIVAKPRGSGVKVESSALWRGRQPWPGFAQPASKASHLIKPLTCRIAAITCSPQVSNYLCPTGTITCTRRVQLPGEMISPDPSYDTPPEAQPRGYRCKAEGGAECVRLRAAGNAGIMELAVVGGCFARSANTSKATAAAWQRHAGV